MAEMAVKKRRPKNLDLPTIRLPLSGYPVNHSPDQRGRPVSPLALSPMAAAKKLASPEK